MSLDKLFRSSHELESPYQAGMPMGVPGKVPVTARLAARPINQIILRAASRDDNGVAADADVAVDRAASSSGQALPGDLRSRFESSLGADLSNVRVHTGAESAQAASAVGARAYATGNDIHFAAGAYDPQSAFGVHLLAHEVAHTVQQQGGAATRQHKLEVSGPADSAEVEADRAADAMVSGARFAVTGSASPVALHRALKAGGGGELNSGGASLAFAVTIEKEIPGKYASYKFTDSVAVTGSLKPKEGAVAPLPGNATGGEEVKNDGSAHKVSVEVYKAEAQAGAAQAVKDKVFSLLDAEGYGVDSVELEGEVGSGTDAATGADKTSLAIGAKITHKNKNSSTITFTLAELTKGQPGKFVAGELAHAMKIASFKAWENDKAEATVAVNNTIKAGVEPNWPGIVAELQAKLGPQLKQMMVRALQAAASEAFIAVGAGAAIVGSMGYALAKGASDLADARVVVGAANRARSSYAAGYAAGFGCEGTGQDAAAFAAGQATGASKLGEVSAQTRAKVTDFEFTQEEMSAALSEAANKHKAALVQAGMRACSEPIGRQFVEAYWNANQTVLGRIGLSQTTRMIAGQLGIAWTPPEGVDHTQANADAAAAEQETEQAYDQGMRDRQQQGFDDDGAQSIPADELDPDAGGMSGGSPQTGDAPETCDPANAECEDAGPRAD